MDKDEFSPSELIYLYLDGEADAEQCHTLFAALACDTDLQVEFHDALGIQRALAAEVREGAPPIAIEQSLFRKAGILPPVGVVQAVGTASWAVRIGTARTVLLSVLAVVAGALIAMPGISPWWQESGMDAQVWLPKTTNKQELTVRMPMETNTAKALLGIPEQRKEAKGALLSDGRKHRLEKRRVERFAPVSNGIGNNEKSAALMQSVSVTPVQLIGTVPTTVVPAPLHPLHEQLPVLHTMDNTEARSTEHTVWKLYTRGIAGMRVFPWRALNNYSTTAIENAAIGGWYQWSEEWAIGAEIGQEILPLYIAASGGSFRLQPTIQWAGIGVQYIPEFARIGKALQPFASALVGGAISGPIAKSMVGLQWQPDSRVALFLGIEGTAQLYRYQEQWYGIQKLGMSYGVEVKF